MTHTIHRLPATLMRGGTSKGLFFRADALPDDPELCQQLLLRAIGSPDPYGRQIDGLGSGISSTSKVVILSASSREDCDVDYLFGHVAIADALIDWSGNCGNLSAAVPVFALLEKLATPADGRAEVHIWQANIGKKIVAELEVKNGQPVWTGDFAIDGVAFPAAPITLRFLDPAGGAAGKLFPTGRRTDTLALPDGREIDATLIDAGNPTVFVAAADLGLRGDETAAELDEAMLAQLEHLRAAGSVAMGLCPDLASASRERPATPKISFLSAPRAEGDHLDARILSMGRLHHAYTGTGAIALAVAASLPDTVASRVAGKVLKKEALRFAHASGGQELQAVVKRHGRGWKVEEVVMVRSARPLMAGEVYVPLPAAEPADADATLPERDAIEESRAGADISSDKDGKPSEKAKPKRKRKGKKKGD